jgi:hypothetical protein
MRKGDTNRPRSVKAEFDENFSATSNGGAVLSERALRSLGARRYIKRYLPPRSPEAEYSMEEAVYGLMSGLIVGGKGMKAGECLREDELLSEIFGFEKGVASCSTSYRVLCELSGLPERKREDCYVSNGPTREALDMFGQARKKPKLRRVVPEEAEAARPERLDGLDAFTTHLAVKCAKAVKQNVMRMHGWYLNFGDATDLEVDGDCFDAARMGRDGNKVMRWQTVMLGPIIVAQQLGEGNVDEGLSMPRLLKQAEESVRAIVGSKGRVLGLYDAAYFEKQVTDLLSEELHWDFIICANQQREILRRLAEEQPEWVWKESGADAGRGWSRSQVCSFGHMPKNWKRPVNIIARRWIPEGELNGTWHYSFLATRLEPSDLPKRLLKRHGYCSTIWMLYGTKQGRENHYKTCLRDFGLHHPPSCRLGVNQAFYTIAVAASNVAMVMRYRVMAKDEGAIAFWRLRERYFRISGYLVNPPQAERRLTVRLSGVCVDALRQTLRKQAFAAAGRL